MNIGGPPSVYEVKIYDMAGQLVRTDIATRNSILIQRGSLSGGIYIYTVTAGGVVIGKGKMTIE
jgi:hypothetical protein